MGHAVKAEAMYRGLAFIFLLNLFMQAKVYSLPCSGVFVKLNPTAQARIWNEMKSGFSKTDRFVRLGSSLVLQGGVYPIWASFDLFRTALQSFQSTKPKSYGLFPRLKEHGLRLPFFLAALFLSRGSVVSTSDFANATSEFEEPEDDDVIMVINGFSETDINFPDPRADFEYQFGDWEIDKSSGALGAYAENVQVRRKGKRVAIYAEPFTIESMHNLLGEIPKKFGLVTKLDFRGHGLPGEILIRDVPYNARDLRNLTNRGPTFRANSKVRFFSCLVGNGKTGDKFVSAFAEQYLQNGGDIAATQPTSFEPSLMLSLGTEKVGLGRLPRNLSRLSDQIFSYSIPIAAIPVPVIEGFTRSPALFGYEKMYTPLQPIKKYHFEKSQ